MIPFSRLPQLASMFLHHFLPCWTFQSQSQVSIAIPTKPAMQIPPESLTDVALAGKVSKRWRVLGLAGAGKVHVPETKFAVCCRDLLHDLCKSVDVHSATQETLPENKGEDEINRRKEEEQGL